MKILFNDSYYTADVFSAPAEGAISVLGHRWVRLSKGGVAFTELHSDDMKGVYCAPNSSLHVSKAYRGGLTQLRDDFLDRITFCQNGRILNDRYIRKSVLISTHIDYIQSKKGCILTKDINGHIKTYSPFDLRAIEYTNFLVNEIANFYISALKNDGSLYFGNKYLREKVPSSMKVSLFDCDECTIYCGYHPLYANCIHLTKYLTT